MLETNLLKPMPMAKLKETLFMTMETAVTVVRYILTVSTL